MLQQKVILHLKSEGGVKLGDLVIGASFSGTVFQSDRDRIESFDYDNSYLENILKTTTPGDTIPIEFLEKTNEHLEKGIMLLEETDYQYLFKSNYDIDETNGDGVLLELNHGSNNRSVVI